MTLPVVGEIGAGQAGLRALGPGAAAKIMTGAPVPDGADAVVPYEWTDRGADAVRIEPGARAAPAHPARRRRRRRGRPARRAGRHPRAAPAGAAGLGRPRDRARRGRGRGWSSCRPAPSCASPGAELGHDSIYDGNSFLLAAAVRRAGAIPYRVGIVPDEPAAFLEALHDQLVRADVVITSGGVSQGDYDVVKAALAPDGVWFGPVAMQPGKPQGFGRVGEDRVPIFTLPGNPVSSYISFQVFVLPALRKLMGKEPYAVPTVRARLTKSLSSPGGRRQYRRGEVGVDEQGTYVAPVGGAGSHLVGDLASADCLIVVPEDDDLRRGGGDRRGADAGGVPMTDARLAG